LSVYLNIAGLQIESWKNVVWVLESSGKVLDFFVSKSGNPVFRGSFLIQVPSHRELVYIVVCA